MKPGRRSMLAAIKLLQSHTDTLDTVAQAGDKAERNRNLLTAVWDDLESLSRVVRSWARGTYREVPWKTVVLSAAAIVYFLNPVDVVPDVFPLLGFVDDVAVIRYVIAAIHGDLSRFRAWEQSRLQPEQAPIG